MKKVLGVGLFLALPLVIMFIAGLSIIFFIIFASGGGVQDELETTTETTPGEGHLAYCSVDGEVDMKAWNAFFDDYKKSGALQDYGDHIKEYSEEQGIDPVLVMSIMAHETGYGTSTAILEKNNPGGIMDWDNNWETLKHFRTLKDGINYTIDNIAKLILERGLVTIEDLGNTYAPIGADNDPNGLNKNWIPTVTKLSNELGGLTQNCSKVGDLEFEGDMAWIVPATKRITSGFGPRSCDGCSPYHNGLDISKGPGQSNGLETVALADGEVIASLDGCTEASCSSTWGNHVMIQHDDGLMTIYAHFEKTLVKNGQKVEAGDIIGRIGNTGSSVGAHLHFETHVNGEPVDPYKLLSKFFKDK